MYRQFPEILHVCVMGHECLAILKVTINYAGHQHVLLLDSKYRYHKFLSYCWHRRIETQLLFGKSAYLALMLMYCQTCSL